MNWKQNVAANFDNKAEFYERESRIQKVVAQTLMADLPEGREAEKIENILEVGCGTGYLTRLLFEKYNCKNICVSDISPSMVAQAQVNSEEYADINRHTVNWAVFDAENPPEDMESKYDLIVANMVFQWFEDAQSAMKKLNKLLRPGGRIMYSTLGSESFMEWKSVLRSLELPIGILDFDTPADIYKEEFLIRGYDDARAFLRSMKDMGAGQAKKGYTPLSTAQIRNACDAFNKRYDTNITWHILYGEARRKNTGIVGRLKKLGLKRANEV